MKAETAALGHRKVLKSLSGLLLALFVAMVSATVVATALPRIIGSLNGSQTQYTWVVTATLLAATATTPIWGRLADLFNKKALLQAAIVVFVIGSLLSGSAQNTGQLIAARAFQGLGVGGMQALVQVVIATIIPPRERGRYNGYLGAVIAVATVGGPLLGGLIVDVSWLGWRWCFWFTVPISAIAFVVLHVTLKLETVRREDARIDYLGAGLIAAGVSVLLIWVSFVGNSFEWVSWHTAAMIAATLVLLAVAVVVELKVPEPVVPLGIIAQRTPALAIIASLSAGTAMFGGAVFLSQYFQIGRGYTPTQAGLLTIPLMAGVVASSTISGHLISRSGAIKPYIVSGTVILVAGFLGLGLIDHATALWIIGVAMAAVGIGVGMTMQNLVLAVQNSVSLRDLGAASASVTFFRSLGGTIGISVLGAVLANRVTADPHRPVGQSMGDATADIFLIAAAVAAVGVVAALLLKPITLRTTVDLGKEASSIVPGVRSRGG